MPTTVTAMHKMSLSSANVSLHEFFSVQERHDHSEPGLANTVGEDISDGVINTLLQLTLRVFIVNIPQQRKVQNKIARK